MIGKDILHNNAVQQHAQCASARAARLGSHAARGGRGGRSSASTMRVVVIWLGSHDAHAAGGAPGDSQQFNMLF